MGRLVKTVKATRRSFLGLLGLSPIAGPLAAKAAVDKEISSLIGFSGMLANEQQRPADLGGDKGAAPDYDKIRIAASEYARHLGVPEFVQETLRRRAQYVPCLDPDIANKRAWSMSVKIMTQRQRNYEALVEQLHHTGWHARASMAFRSLTKWEWPL